MYNFKEVEKEVSNLWNKDKKKIKDSLQFNSKKKLYSFLEGPPTANAPPALHHVEVRVFKDLFCKFKSMQGFNVPRKGGWDTHGLPVEVQIEKKLNLNSKKDIETYGVAKFNKQCKDSVFEYIEEWNKLTDKMAYWVDLDNPYITLNKDYMESVWWSLKELYKKGLLYESHKVVPYCPRCETPLSSHEVSQGYKDVKDLTVVVKFKLKNKNRVLLAWTTTPWTLPSNLALAVNSNYDYAVVKQDNVEYVLAKELVSKYFENPKVIETIKGKDLVNLQYEPLFDYFVNKLDKPAFKVIAGDFVTTDEGTGIVHMAPAFGEVDYDACKKAGLAFVQPVDTEGKFTDEVPEFKGKFVKSADKLIIEKLDKENLLFKKEHYTHTYPFCWRCDTPLIYYAMISWFIQVTKYKDKLIKNNEKINWYPSHIKEGRFGDWLANVKDWALSRKKFWGTPLPIWRSEDGDEICIGSVKELEELSGKKISDLHKPLIDEIVIKKKGKTYRRVPDVIDTWYDSGSASFAQYHYPFENKALFEKSYPYDFIAEAIDQTRGWFYTLHVLGTLLFDDVAYKNVVCAGHVVDENGEKMSKSKGNVLNPWEMFDVLGVDAVRLQFCSSQQGDPKRFGVHLVNQQVSPFLTVLWNSYVYYKSLNNKVKGALQPEDKWIISRANSLVKEVTENLEKHNYHICFASFLSFIDDLSRNYIKFIRERDDIAVNKTLEEVFEILLKLLAPFAPYISEYIYQDMKKRESIHLSSWPKPNTKLIDKNLEENFILARQIMQEISSQREKAQLGIRWPLAKATVSVEHPTKVKDIKNLIEKQMNIKKIEFKKGNLQVKLDTKLTKELEQEGFSREITRKVQDLRKKIGLVKENKIELFIVTPIDITKFTEDLALKVGAEEIFFEYKDFKDVQEFKIKEKQFKIGIKLIK